MFHKQCQLYFLVLLLAIFIKVDIYAQDTSKANESYEIVEIYIWGYPMSYNDWNVGCIKALQQKYGFTEVGVGGCVVDGKELKKWEKHNKKANKKMEERHGENWRVKYYDEYKGCKITMEVLEPELPEEMEE